MEEPLSSGATAELSAFGESMARIVDRYRLVRRGQSFWTTRQLRSDGRRTGTAAMTATCERKNT
jgi:hypothetical protein